MNPDSPPPVNLDSPPPACAYRHDARGAHPAMLVVVLVSIVAWSAFALGYLIRSLVG